MPRDILPRIANVPIEEAAFVDESTVVVPDRKRIYPRSSRMGCLSSQRFYLFVNRSPVQLFQKVALQELVTRMSEGISRCGPRRSIDGRAVRSSRSHRRRRRRGHLFRYQSRCEKRWGSLPQSQNQCMYVNQMIYRQQTL